jgi:hypothetical protein
MIEATSNGGGSRLPLGLPLAGQERSMDEHRWSRLESKTQSMALHGGSGWIKRLSIWIKLNSS